jgi:hypothetical protein
MTSNETIDVSAVPAAEQAQSIEHMLNEACDTFDTQVVVDETPPEDDRHVVLQDACFHTMSRFDNFKAAALAYYRLQHFADRMANHPHVKLSVRTNGADDDMGDAELSLDLFTQEGNLDQLVHPLLMNLSRKYASTWVELKKAVDEGVGILETFA